jgi:hypothetical protein
MVKKGYRTVYSKNRNVSPSRWGQKQKTGDIWQGNFIRTTVVEATTSRISVPSPSIWLILLLFVQLAL